MDKEISDYLEKYSENIRTLFGQLEDLINQSCDLDINEKMWAKLPSYYVGESFVRLIPFKDHINVEAKAILSNAEMFKDYKLTPKGMLQLYHGKEIPTDALLKVFKETLVH